MRRGLYINKWSTPQKEKTNKGGQESGFVNYNLISVLARHARWFSHPWLPAMAKRESFITKKNLSAKILSDGDFWSKLPNWVGHKKTVPSGYDPFIDDLLMVIYRFTYKKWWFPIAMLKPKGSKAYIFHMVFLQGSLKDS